jgi:hypothetical protein
MKNLSALAFLFCVVGCASSSENLVKRRDEIRRLANAPLNEKYRSADGVRGTTWGMTPDEVIALKGAPERRSENALMYHDPIDIEAEPTTYGFFEGHLAVVKTHFEHLYEGRRRLEQGLTLKYGPPTSTFNKYEDTQNAVNAAVGIDVALSILGGIAGVASHHGVYPLFFGPRVGEATFIRKSLENAAKPAVLVTWRAPETEVHLTGFDTGATDVTWTSHELGARFARQQASAAGLETMGENL